MTLDKSYSFILLANIDPQTDTIISRRKISCIIKFLFTYIFLKLKRGIDRETKGNRTPTFSTMD